MAEAEKDMKKWLVKDKYCKGCKYYGHLTPGNSGRCCDYTYLTGRFRENPPATCEVRETGKRPSASLDTGYLHPRTMKGGGWHG